MGLSRGSRVLNFRHILAIFTVLAVFVVVLVIPSGEASAVTKAKAEKKCKNWGGTYTQVNDSKATCTNISKVKRAEKYCASEGIDGTWKDSTKSDPNPRCVWTSFTSTDKADADTSEDDSGDSDSGSGTYTGTDVSIEAAEYEDPCPDGIRTSVLGDGGCYSDNGDGDGIFSILALILNIMTIVVGALGVFGIAFSGVQYMTARDNEAQMAKAKQRIFEVVLGLAVYALMYSLLQWLLPGGIFNGG